MVMSTSNTDGMAETGMLDVGTHCQYCRQIDFLPFHCNSCEKDFCLNHRSKESHHCASLLQNGIKINTESQEISKKSTTDNGGKFFQSLLPSKGYIRVNENATSESASKSTEKTLNNHTKTRTIKSTLNQTTLDKLVNFFNKKNKNYSSNKKTFSLKSNKSPNKIIQLSNLQKMAKGDSKIPTQNRIYIWCHCITNDDDDSNTNDDPKPFFVNKLWPIGRVLDYLANQMNISNKNIRFDTLDEEKLFIYKCSFNTNELIELKVNDRVNMNIFNLDTLYLIRGNTKKE